MDATNNESIINIEYYQPTLFDNETETFDINDYKIETILTAPVEKDLSIDPLFYTFLNDYKEEVMPIS